MNHELSTFVDRIRFDSQREVPRERLHELPLVRETFDRLPRIRHVVVDALVAARVASSYDEAQWLTNSLWEVRFQDGEAGRAVMIDYDGGQEIGAIVVNFSNWQLVSIMVDHTEHFFCPLSEKFQQIDLLSL
jgi:hypothetical protein